MLLKNILLLLVIFPSVSSFSQPPTAIWQKNYGGTKWEAWPYLASTTDGGLLMTGLGESEDMDLAGTSNSGLQDIQLFRLNECGSIEWKNVFGGNKVDVAYHLIETADKGILLTGNTSSDNLPGQHGGKDGLLIKTDANGNLQWMKLKGGSNDDGFYKTVVLQDGSLVVAGFTYSSDGDAGPLTGYSSGWLLKLDMDGNIIWKKSCGNGLNNLFRDIISTPDNGFIACGTKEKVLGNPDVWVIKFDADGNTLWEKEYGGTQSEMGNAIRKTNSPGYIVAGYTASADGDVTNARGGSDAWVLRITEDGNLTWQKTVGGSEGDDARAILVMPDNTFFLTGATGSGNGDIITTAYGASDGLAFSLNDSGDLLWLNTYGGNMGDFLVDAFQRPDGAIFFSGMSTSKFTGNIKDNYGNSDILLYKFKDVPRKSVDTFSCKPIQLGDFLVTKSGSVTVHYKYTCSTLQALYDSVIVDYNVIITPAFLRAIPDAMISQGETITLTVQSSGAVEWTGAGLSCYQCFAPSATPLTNSVYIVSTKVGECTISDTVHVTVISGDTLYIPSAFTPNNDGLNDRFRVYGQVTDYSLSIYNRWGERIFSVGSINQAWDGRYKGNELPNGSFIYHIRYKNLSGIMKQKKGTIMLLR